MAISLGAPIVFFIYDSSTSGVLFSFTSFLFLSIWASGFSLDVWTTYKFYAADRGNFSVNETNAVFSRLVEQFGFRKGLAVQLVLVEIPAAMVLAVLLYPVYHTFTEYGSTGIVAVLNLSVSSLSYLPAALCLFGVVHMIDAFVNLNVERKENQSRVKR
ncbi:hypothetical protein NWT39_04710 [Nitrososphaera viennensis]|uniref:Uncharacterized protein n=3 Tax=Nitrososphaera viennensis TaxID=1034015 RepID=A0A060HIM1_9ARCH|nr:hypothetical protein [Nitrososphaera viennensis]AIC15170.1 hypothetical protein NVIE_009450 [Nitrososphaera viennensis EN76]UVS70092.1 hypothetical protein NWT39_04710 [Nitrososphaera viennensis]